MRIDRGDGNPHRLSLLVHRSRTGLVSPMIDFGLEWLSHYPRQPVMTTVRDYETGTVRELKESGFRPLYTRLLIVNHLGIRFKAAAARPALGRVHN